MVNCSLIISFYNRIDYLKLVFAGIERQTCRNFEIILADDGSNISVVREVESLSKQIEFPVIHVWQEDKGFRKNRILNSAIRAASSDYLIFIDGDCIPHRKFVQEHYENRSPEFCLTGRRVNLSQKLTDKLSYQFVKKGFLEKRYDALILDGFFGKSNYVEKGFYFNNYLLRKLLNKKNRGLLGCNFSVNKKSLEKINGFDERYEAASIGEDSDIQFRLELLGIKIKSLNNIAVQYHLYHELQKRAQQNLELFDDVKRQADFFTKFGLQQ
jgi:glycosyltransferase involved in cell wall biosynthesis